MSCSLLLLHFSVSGPISPPTASTPATRARGRSVPSVGVYSRGGSASASVPGPSPIAAAAAGSSPGEAGISKEISTALVLSENKNKDKSVLRSNSLDEKSAELSEIASTDEDWAGLDEDSSDLSLKDRENYKYICNERLEELKEEFQVLKTEFVVRCKYACCGHLRGPLQELWQNNIIVRGVVLRRMICPNCKER